MVTSLRAHASAAAMTLRVLGVQKDKPYAAPGETVNLGQLEYDKVTYVEVVPSEALMRA